MMSAAAVTRLSAAQRKALRHVAEQMAHIEAHNTRWPLDRQIPGAFGGTSTMTKRTVAKLLQLGLVAEVESWPGHRMRGKYALTPAGRAVLELPGEEPRR